MGRSIAAVFIEGRALPSASGYMEVRLPELPPGVSAGYSLAIKKPPPPHVLPRDGGSGSVVLCKAGYDARLAFTSWCSYFPRYSAACMAMMRPELLAQEACEPGARETS